MLLYLKLQIGKCQIQPNTHRKYGKYGQIRGHITYLILAIEKITAERNGYVNELSYVSPDYTDYPDYPWLLINALITD